MKTILISGLALIAVACASAALDTKKIDELTGLKGKANEKENTYKVTFPRDDVKVVVDGWTMPPFMGLGTWAAFTPAKDGAMVMGNEIFGAQGESKDGMVKFTFGRPATMHGVKIDNTMGVNTWAAFAGSDDNAVVDGDFAVTEDELQPTVRSLLKEKINIVAIHQHMTHEQPRMMFFHYWGRGRAKDLAQAIKGAFLVAGLQEVASPIHN
jgi:hypothetical protein